MRNLVQTFTHRWVHPWAAVACLALVLFGLPACKKTTLAPGGAYTDVTLYQTDKTITSSEALLHSFVSWELQNRTLLAQWPEIKKVADAVRGQAPGAIKAAIAARDAYANAKTAENANTLSITLTTLKALALQASVSMLGGT